MNKKFQFWFLGASFLVCAFFYKLQGVGLCLQLMAHFQYQCQLRCGEIEWRKGKLYLKDVVCQDPTFCLRTSEAVYSFSERHLEAKRPVITLFKPSDQIISFDGTVVVADGVIECPGAAPVQFSLDWQGHAGTFNLECLNGSAVIEIDPDSTQVMVHEWPASVLGGIARFYALPIPPVTEGVLTGLVDVSKEIHGQLSVKNLTVPEVQLEDLEGSVSYHSNLGAKWELKGKDISCCGRTYLKSELSNWTDVELTLGKDTHIFVQGRDENWEQIWTMRYEHLGAVQASLELRGQWEDWKGQVSALGSSMDIWGGFQNGELGVQGEWKVRDNLAVKCLSLCWKDGQIDFDVRVVGALWDLARCKGSYVDSQVQFDAKSHLLGAPVQFNGNTLEGKILWKMLAALDPTLSELPLQGSALIQISKENITLSSGDLNWNGQSLPAITACLKPFGKTGSIFQIAGAVAGEGHLSWGERLEVDLDLAPVCIEGLETKGPTHLFYTPEQGVLAKGVDLLIPIHCKADVAHFDPVSRNWSLTNARLHIPDTFDGTADFQWSGHRLSAKIRDGWVSFQKAVAHVQEGIVDWDQQTASGFVHVLHQGHRLKVLFEATASSGHCSIHEQPVERPLTLHWNYDEKKGLFFQSIEGVLSGVDASFRAEEPYGNLIGSAHVDFTAISELVPPVIAKVFSSLEMGKGYELKGRLTNQAEFKGILIGKATELFGFEFQTVFANVELNATKVLLTDLKVSDKAGTLVVDQILIEEPSAEECWQLDIPQITILEMRPSLLKKLPLRKEDPLTPLVVRELHLNGLKGIAKDISSYTAEGHLFFINTFRREFSVLDLPADLLSRIVGIDLELLVPVKGTLTYHLKDGIFRLDELKEAFSEGHRSEFFLVDEANPSMDFDGNLNIMIKMKQYVLFKLTESFLISIDGNLGDPKYHLQKRRRFLGL